MATKYVSVLDFGSSKISVMIADSGINGTFNILGTGEVEYSGFQNGEFIEPEKLYEAVANCIVKAETNSGLKVEKLHIGVPAEFTFVETKNASVAFNKKVKIGDKEVSELFSVAGREIKYEKASIISRAPIYFLLDDSRKVIDPKGEVSTRLSGLVSFVVADNRFIDMIDGIVKNMGLKEVEYVSSSLSQSLFLLDPQIRDSGAILIDVGYLTTSVALVKGDGLMALNHFSVGGGHISADLCQVLQISFKEAENLKRKVVLSLSASDNDFYEINLDGVITPISAKLTNDIVASRLDMIVGLINKCLTKMRAVLPQGSNYLPIFLTGGGVCLLKGGRDYISKGVGENVEVLSCKIPQMSKPSYSSVLGLLDLEIKEKKTEKTSLWQKI
ncbi:MAG: rod shape-determining protein, partial [Clostridia bacterium]|nr:rod shape-determining protein [Clostridia bacterium]